MKNTMFYLLKGGFPSGDVQSCNTMVGWIKFAVGEIYKYHNEYLSQEQNIVFSKSLLINLKSKLTDVYLKASYRGLFDRQSLNQTYFSDVPVVFSVIIKPLIIQLT